MKRSNWKLVVMVLSATLTFAVQAGVPTFQPSSTFLQFNPTMVGGLVKSLEDPPVPLTITNAGTATLNITSATISNPEFSLSPASVALPTSVPASGNTQPFVVVFSPSGPGMRTGDLVVQDDAAGSPHTIQLIGFGVDVAPGDFALVPPANNINLLTQSLPVSATAMYDFSVTGGPNTINLSCSGAPPEGSCSVLPSISLDTASVLGSDSTIPVRVSVATSAPTMALRGVHPGFWWTLAGTAALALIAGRKRGARVVLLMICAVAMMSGITTCGSGSNPGTPAGSYTITVTATGNGGIVHSIPLTLNLRPFGTP